MTNIKALLLSLLILANAIAICGGSSQSTAVEIVPGTSIVCDSISGSAHHWYKFEIPAGADEIHFYMDADAPGLVGAIPNICSSIRPKYQSYCNTNGKSGIFYIDVFEVSGKASGKYSLMIHFKENVILGQCGGINPTETKATGQGFSNTCYISSGSTSSRYYSMNQPASACEIRAYLDVHNSEEVDLMLYSGSNFVDDNMDMSGGADDWEIVNGSKLKTGNWTIAVSHEGPKANWLPEYTLYTHFSGAGCSKSNALQVPKKLYVKGVALYGQETYYKLVDDGSKILKLGVGGNVDVYLYDSSNLLAWSDESDNDYKTVERKFPGTYYLKIKAKVIGFEVYTIYWAETGCGNTYCEQGESYTNCPQDCCNSDCTGKGDDLCHSQCIGYNGCGQVTGLCEGKPKTTQCYDTCSEITCCDGGQQSCGGYLCVNGGCKRYGGYCSQSCGAACDEDADCSAANCQNYCDIKKKCTYQSTGAANYCNEYCSCTSSSCGTPNCSCVKGECGAECSSNRDCSPPQPTCNYESKTYTWYTSSCTSGCTCVNSQNTSEPSDSNYCDNCNHCSDGVLNCGETEIDCGGNCQPCAAVCGNKICETGETKSNCCTDCGCEVKTCPGNYCDYKNKAWCKSPPTCVSSCQENVCQDCTCEVSCSSSDYCSNCIHCGDGEINCGETYESCLEDHENLGVITSVDKLDTDLPESDTRYMLDDGTNQRLVEVKADAGTFILGLEGDRELTLAKMISTTNLGKRRVFVRVWTMGAQAEVQVNDQTFVHPEIIPSGVKNSLIGLWSDWEDITENLTTDISNFEIKLGKSYNEAYGVVGLNIQFRVVDPDKDFVILATPILISPFNGIFEEYQEHCSAGYVGYSICKDWHNLLDNILYRPEYKFEIMPLEKIHDGEFEKLVNEEIEGPIENLFENSFPGENISQHIKVIPLTSLCRIETDFTPSASVRGLSCGSGSPYIYDFQLLMPLDRDRFHLAVQECLDKKFSKIRPGQFFGGRIIAVDLTPNLHPLFIQTEEARYEEGWNRPWSPIIYTKANYTKEFLGYSKIELTRDIQYDLGISLGLNPETSCSTCTKPVCSGPFGPNPKPADLIETLERMKELAKEIRNITVNKGTWTEYQGEDPVLELLSVELYKRAKFYGCGNHNTCDSVCPECEKACLGSCSSPYVMGEGNGFPQSESDYLKGVFACDFNIAGKRNISNCELTYDGPVDRDVIETIRQFGLIVQLETVKAASYLAPNNVDFHALDDTSNMNIGELRAIADEVCRNYSYAVSDMQMDCCETCSVEECAFNEDIYMPNSDEVLKAGDAVYQVMNLCVVREKMVASSEDIVEILRKNPALSVLAEFIEYVIDIHEMFRFYQIKTVSTSQMRDIHSICNSDSVCDYWENSLTCTDCPVEKKYSGPKIAIAPTNENKMAPIVIGTPANTSTVQTTVAPVEETKTQASVSTEGYVPQNPQNQGSPIGVIQNSEPTTGQIETTSTPTQTLQAQEEASQGLFVENLEAVVNIILKPVEIIGKIFDWFLNQFIAFFL